ncbi:MAG: Fis family transcriptional regulator [Deltaproteobacteria bacterium CG11_big_fil_rev_8_21_14_0_20_45_16]|nr:MAG: Fis family transcriptional regulator [Deltaproteobacteria bacterium CG11_big_fil_rev_8_21_14_0_20_45_16]
MDIDQGLSEIERLKWYERILKLSQKASKESLESICQYLMDDAIAGAEAEVGYLILFDDQGKARVSISRQQGRENLPKGEWHFSESIIKRSLEMAAPLILDDASAHPDFGQAKSVIAGNLKSVLVLPLFFEKRSIGVIYLENRSQKSYFSPHLLEVLTLFSTQGAVLLHAKLKEEGPRPSQVALNETGVPTKNLKMLEVFKQAQAVSKTESSILILGETGTGKEVLARYIHQQSQRANRDFVAINCSAIPETLIESELFGYKKGAFTGAVSDRQGLIAKADGGTLFLDEIGDLPLHMQAKLLRVLQEKSFMPVGSTVEQRSDFRLIAATHNPLEESVNQGFFRQDLYFRINTLTFKLPALRERPEDVLNLALHFARKLSAEYGHQLDGLDEGAAGVLLNFPWPGNIRQLQNAIQRAVVLSMDEPDKKLLSASDFSFLSEAPTPSNLPSLQEAKDQFIKDYVKKAILIHKGNKTKAAKALGVDPKTLYRHLSDKKED